jgi:hypothetical protein
MSSFTPVPADDEAGSVVDLVADCREVSGVLAPYLPVGVRPAGGRASGPVQIDASAAAGLAGWEDYGS